MVEDEKNSLKLASSQINCEDKFNNSRVVGNYSLISNKFAQ